MDKTCWVLTGPTASGKTSLSIKLACEHNCEIICMDSMQIYRHMDIGTAKPTAKEQAGVPHHMLDIVEPSESYSVAQYVAEAQQCADEIFARGKRPFFVGGTGFYFRGLRCPMSMGNTPGNEEIRQKYQNILHSSENGAEILHEKLSLVDSATAARLHVNDTRRVIRALEVYELTGIPFSAQSEADGEPKFQYRAATLNMNRQVLYGRIEQRVDQMFKSGLVDEVNSLLKMGIDENSQAMKGIGYKEIVPYIHGQCSLGDTVALIKQNTRHYAKRQLTWMRREENVLWVDALTESAYNELSDWYERESIDENEII